MGKWLEKVPRWVLVGIILSLAAPAAYALRAHIREDERQTTVLQEASNAIHDVSVIIDYNTREVDRLSTDVEKLMEAQKRLELLIVRHGLDRGDRE